MFRLRNPQLRVFLPDFWMRLVRPPKEVAVPKNKVQFVVPLKMSCLDVKDYLEKIYKVPVMDVNVATVAGKTHQHSKEERTYKDDRKVAFVTLPADRSFDFPEVVRTEKSEEDLEKGRNDLEQVRCLS